MTSAEPAPENPAVTECDIAILGAGPTGLALALALRDGPWRVALFDAAPATAGRPGGDDPRAIALSEGSWQLLERLGVWPAATPIQHIDISQQGGRGATTLHADGLGLAALGHVARYSELLQSLRTEAERAGLPISADCRANAITAIASSAGDGCLIRFDQGGSVRCRLVVHAEGTHGEDSWHCDYAQTAIVCEATPTLPHAQLAYERFTPAGPLALLPLGERYAIVRVVDSAARAALMELDDAAFGRELTSSLGHRVAFSAVGRRSTFPLALKLRKQLQKGQEVWIGNAAQTLHPVSGQGFNLGLRDAWTLAEALYDSLDRERAKPGRLAGESRESNKHSQKFSGNATLAATAASHASAAANAALGAPTLAAWARARQPDRLATAAFTDGIVRVFSNDLAPLRQARGFGLQVLETLPGLRNFVARRMIWGARGW